MQFRVGVGGRVGALFQSVSNESSKAAFGFGPEAVVGARFFFGRTFFTDLSGAGNVVFTSEEHELEGVLGGTGVLAIGARF